MQTILIGKPIKTVFALPDPLHGIFMMVNPHLNKAIKLVALTIPCHCKGKISFLLNSEELGSWFRTHLKEQVAHS